MKHLLRIFLSLVCALCFPMLAQSTELELELDIEAKGAPINPFIYGQFIEHLGRCIYGGIWAEMLEDRKFYFPVTAEYDPYRKLTNTGFPVVGGSPWEITGNPDGVSMVTVDSFVGEHTPLIEAGSGIRQHDLALVEGKKYTGYIWLKSDGQKSADVKLTVLTGSKGDLQLEETIRAKPDEYFKVPFSFKATADSNMAILAVEVQTGTVQVGTLSLMPADNVQGMRADTLAILRELDAPLYRWPGGNFVSGYNWRDGIGDRDRRPPRKNPAWTGIEHNDFGTDEYIAFCRLINTEPAIAANTGFGDAYSAAQWVEYCNSEIDTVGGSWRIENGNKEPYNVKYWCLGNEMWGPWQLGFMQLSHYVLKNNRVADAMWAVDPELELIAVGAVDQINKDYDPRAARENKLWSVGMLEESTDHMTFLSEHFYAGRTPWSKGSELDPVAHVKLLKEQIKRISDEHRRLQPTIAALDGRTMPIAMDEWNYWHRDYRYGELGCIYDLKDALGTVIGLHEFYRQSDLIQIANYAQTVNVIGCVKTTKTEAFFDATGIALKLYRAEWQPIPLDVEDRFGDYDIAASVSEDGKVLTVSVVNPSSDPLSVTLSIKDKKLPMTATSWTITGPDHRARNGPDGSVVDATKAKANIGAGLDVPALSSVLYRIQL